MRHDAGSPDVITDAERFARWLKAARALAGYTTQAALARDTGITPSQIAKWERGEGGTPSVDSARRLRDAFTARGLTDDAGRPLTTGYVLVVAGALDPSELGMHGVPETPATPPVDPDAAGLDAWLRDPDVPDDRKALARDYLRYLRGRAS